MPESLTPPPLSDAGPFSPEQKEYLQGFMAGVLASGAFVGSNAAGQLTADVAAATGGNLAAPEASFHGAPLGDLCKE